MDALASRKSGTVRKPFSLKHFAVCLNPLQGCGRSAMVVMLSLRFLFAFLMSKQR
jgi:hypothetical protein